MTVVVQGSHGAALLVQNKTLEVLQGLSFSGLKIRVNNLKTYLCFSFFSPLRWQLEDIFWGFCLVGIFCIFFK